MSAPAAKARSDPVMTMAPMALSASKASSAWPSSVTSWSQSAFSALGRFRVIEPDGATGFDEDGFIRHGCSTLPIWRGPALRRPFVVAWLFWFVGPQGPCGFGPCDSGDQRGFRVKRMVVPSAGFAPDFDGPGFAGANSSRSSSPSRTKTRSVVRRQPSCGRVWS